MIQIVEEILGKLPKDAKISEATFEGANIVLYTKNKDFFLNNNGIIREIVNEIKKRVELRPDPSLLLDMEESEAIIKSLIPKEAGVENILFDHQRSIVIIESEKPGLVIGKVGELLKEIRKKTLWVPIVQRTPALKSQLIENIRSILYEDNDYRKKFLDRTGRRIYGGLIREKKKEWIRVSILGGGREVGRSCLLLQTAESRVLLDCGINAALTLDDPNSFPFLDAPEFNIQDLDAVIISHSHTDHCALVPLLYKFGYTGPTYCTLPTRDISALLCLDLIGIAQKEAEKALYSSTDVKNMVRHTICLDYEEVTDITPDVRLTLYNSGHTLGSSMVHLHIGNGLHNLVYSLDSSTKATILDKDNNVQFIGIGDFIDKQFEGKASMLYNDGYVQEMLNTKSYRTISFNPKTQKSEIVNITSFVRHPINEDLYEIETESGRSIKVTKSHSIFTAKDGKIIPQEVSKLNEKDFIIGSKKLPTIHREPIIDLLPHLGDLRIRVEDDEKVYNLISNHKKDFVKLKESDKEIAEKILFDHYKGCYKKDIKKKYKIHKRRVIRILNTLGVKSQPRVKEAFSDRIKITKDFSRFLGYYLSEGYVWTRSQTIGITNYNNEILEDCYRIIKKELGIEGKIRYEDKVVIFNSKQLKYLVSTVLKCGKNAYEKRVPQELLLAKKEVASNLLYGLFSGDGGIRIRKKGREINYGTKSKNLIQDIAFMLLQFGLVPRLNYNRTSKMHNMHIYNSEKIMTFLDEININNKQKEALKESLNVKRLKGSFDMRIPLLALSKKAQATLLLSPWRASKSCGIAKLENEYLNEDDFKIADSDLLFDSIKSIKRIKPTGKYVYDFRIDGYENFLGGEGFLFMHNTGDFNYETSNLLAPAITRFPRLETLMTEGTYGLREDAPTSRADADKELIEIVERTVKRGGKILMPVLGVGRSQEIMVVLERLMREGLLEKIPIFIQGMVWDVTAIHTAYPDFFNNRVRKMIFHKDQNPFLSDIFKKIKGHKEMMQVFEETGPCIIMATSGMMVGGASVEYFKLLANNPKNSLIFTCYQGQGSLGRRIQDGDKEIIFQEGEKKDAVPVRMEIYSIKGFTGHSDYTQLLSFIRHLSPRPKKIIINHGEATSCLELASALHKTFRVETEAPKNLEVIRIK
ncbi:MBL fold metallo-hydrolase [Candidatus Woesearchaeota archaeon]|nr:MBL fold metallo-hydrolase [Candidatus Woesearchaeota archaeon]